MRIFLAGNTIFPAYIAPTLYGGGFSKEITQHRPYILESFFYADADTERLIPYFGDFLLDSGAFTFIQGQKGKGNIDWDGYVERYAEFINRNKVERYFELDIDSIVGYKKVVEYRERLERLTGVKPIPVWHLSRGKEEFTRHCEEYPYVALGGIVNEQRGGTKYKIYHGSFPYFIDVAHRHGCKIHGLGFTNLEGLKKYHFDSVDSTAWTTGNRFGHIYRFNGETMVKVKTPQGKRIGDSRKLALINYCEWIKFQKYALTNL